MQTYNHFFLSKTCTSCLFLLMLSLPGFAQGNGFFYFPKHLDKVEIPIRIHQNQLIVELKINQSPPKLFLLDSGAEATLVHDPQLWPFLQKKYARACQIGGHGPEHARIAQALPQNSIQIGQLRGDHQTLLYLEGKDYLSPRIGLPISGVLGFSIFQSLVAELDYGRSVLILYRSENFQVNPQQISLPLLSNSLRPFIQLDLVNTQGGSTAYPFLIDTGASLSVWLPSKLEARLTTFRKQPAYIGTGIYGPILGRRFEIPRLQIGSLAVQNVPVYSSTGHTISSQSQMAYGILGNDFLKNFRLILNYPQQEMGLLPRPGHTSTWHFSKNATGLEIVAPRNGRREYIVDFVLPNSLGERAGIHPGDQLLEINGIPVYQYSLDRVIRLLLGDGGPVLFLKLKKGQKLYVTQIRLP